MKLWTAAVIAATLLVGVVAGGATILGLMAPVAGAAEPGGAVDPRCGL